LLWSRIFDHLLKQMPIFVAAPNALLGFKIDLPDDIREARRNSRIRPSSMSKIVGARAATISVTRLAGIWCGMRSIAERNTPTSPALGRVKIGLVGCGTIGSHLAKMLVQMGAGVDARLE